MGGDISKFREWVSQNIKFPQIAMENGIQGVVTVEFVVDERGKITRIKVVQSPDRVLTEAVITVLNKANTLSHGWSAGKQRGKAVKQRFVFPIAFILQN